MGDEGGKDAESGSNPLLTAKAEIEDEYDAFILPSDVDFDEAVGEEERTFYLEKFEALKVVKDLRLHCSACDKHLGLLTRYINRYRMHPLLRTLVCVACQDFYCSGEFEKGDDGSELYCRWCGQGGQVYCCVTCPAVFCEKCIKRNFGPSKITEIESIDEWKCFVCNPKTLWSLRAKYWILLLYCDFKNRQAQIALDPTKKGILMKQSQVDVSECCKRAIAKPKTPISETKRKSIAELKKMVSSDLAKPSIEQSKANIIDQARQAIKRIGSPVSVKKVPATNVNPSIFPLGQALSSPPNKRMRMPSPKFAMRPQMIMPLNGPNPMIRPERRPRKSNPGNFGDFMAKSYSSGIRDCYTNAIPNDNLNLSLESLTQGLDMSQLANMQPVVASEEDNVVCTPDFPLPLEPLCEVIEAPPRPETPVLQEKKDDDVQCLTPPAGDTSTSPGSVTSQPKLTPRPLSALTERRIAPKPFSGGLSQHAFSNIIQMTENDVTVNEATGGLKFKVDPSTLSSSKMYKLPDGRVFAVNTNPKMPGGYSATIVSVNDAAPPRPGPPPRQPHSQRLQQRLMAQSNQTPQSRSHLWTTPTTTPTPSRGGSSRGRGRTTRNSRAAAAASAPESENTDSPVTGARGSLEWYKFNVLDSIDLMNYVLTRLVKLKDPPGNLRNKNVEEMKWLHQNFDQLLKTSCRRFAEVRSNLNEGFKGWLKENNAPELFSDDEDEVQILQSEGRPLPIPRPKAPPAKPPPRIDDEPIFIDENSNDSVRESGKDGDLSNSADTSETCALVSNDSVNKKNTIDNEDNDLDKSIELIDDGCSEKESDKPGDDSDKSFTLEVEKKPDEETEATPDEDAVITELKDDLPDLEKRANEMEQDADVKKSNGETSEAEEIAEVEEAAETAESAEPEEAAETEDPLLTDDSPKTEDPGESENKVSKIDKNENSKVVDVARREEEDSDGSLTVDRDEEELLRDDPMETADDGNVVTNDEPEKRDNDAQEVGDEEMPLANGKCSSENNLKQKNNTTEVIDDDSVSRDMTEISCDSTVNADSEQDAVHKKITIEKVESVENNSSNSDIK